MNNMVEYAFKELKRWYVEANTSWDTFYQLREEFITRHGYRTWMVGAIAFKQTGVGNELLGDFQHAQVMAMMNAQTVIATRLYEQALADPIDTDR